MDYGLIGLEQTIEILSKSGIDYLGVSTNHNRRFNQPILLNQDKSKVAIFNSAEGEEGLADLIIMGYL